MAAAVAVPFSAISEHLGGVLPPSAVVQHSPRHGRSRGMSMKGKGGRGRGYSVVEERDVTIAKALMFILKRTIQESEVDEEEEVENLVADAEGWVSVDDVLEHPRITVLEADFEDVQRVVANATKARFNLRQALGTADKADEPASWQVRRIGNNRDSVQAPAPVGDKLNVETADLPEFVVYETSYQRYPLILSSGAISRAPGGTQSLVFYPVTVGEDGTESRQSSAGGEAADVSIWIHLRTALETEPSVVWRRTENGAILTADEVPKTLWNKAVARRPDIGVLFEEGEVRKEVPAGLRGRGGKGRAKKGNKATLKREGSGEDSGSASEEQE
ncbi:KptA family-domain-containing protein [Lasiosphaeria miniovina]|uniref:2'-phosphotransferase n=1 Tax=Lasiosphaeria miniovina TaxID=1954250 RepID=A0AA40BJB4_9PEZI|nr:KptA family-domain-containing protein [Lasiosphaeria miniovina]KAK0735285.1 KptA family-domain-containing protein [Lasiosphaeria miniovina]